MQKWWWHFFRELIEKYKSLLVFEHLDKLENVAEEHINGDDTKQNGSDKQ